MQEAGTATAGGRTEFKITRRRPELYLAPLFLLLLCVSIYCFARGQEGGGMWLASCKASSILCVCVAMLYVLFERRLPCRVTGYGFSILCDRPVLLNEITAETVFSAKVLPLLPFVHRFKTRSGDLLAYGSIIHLARFAEALVSGGELERASGQMQLPATFKTVLGRKQFVDFAVLIMPLAVTGALVESVLKPGVTYHKEWGFVLGVLSPTVEVVAGFTASTLAPILGACIGMWLGLKWSQPSEWTFPPSAMGISGVRFAGEMKWALRATYVEDGTTKDVSISQLRVSQSLLPLYFFLRSRQARNAEASNSGGAPQL